MTFQGTSILRVQPVSPASRAGLRPGDRLISCNNSQVRDWVDLLATSSGSAVSLYFSRGPLRRRINLKRRPGVQWGIELEGSQARKCGNRCIFCFVDQQPPGLRKSLLLKDDDVRYSFLKGTYITLTPRQTDEAVARGFSSLHVSVQTTDPVLRGKMLGLPGPVEILPQIDILAESGIEIQAQIVEVPGWNDDRRLENTIADLFDCPNVKILGIVPVGLTKWRKDLEPLARPGREQAERTLMLIEKWQRKALEEKGTPWVYPADEYYAITEKKIPPVSFYNDCSLTANGIGLLAEMISDCRSRKFSGSGMIITGTMAAPFIRKTVTGSDYRVIPVENTLMGSLVSVAGLLSGEDVLNAAKQHHARGETVFLPSVMFNHNGVTLDEYALNTIREITGAKVTSLSSIGELP